MGRSLEELETTFRQAIEEDNASILERVVREVLNDHPETALSSEIRYQRGVLALTWSEGDGSQRLAKAQAEFDAGMRAAETVGETAEPWRTLNRTQLATCLVRLGNTEGATAHLETVSKYRPRTTNGLGALALLAQILRKADKTREAKRYDTQRLSYARALVRENKESPQLNEMRFLLAQQLLDSEYAKEGERLLQELAALEGLEPELQESVQDQLQALEN